MKLKNKDIFVHGKKSDDPPKPRTPIEDPNTLQSRAIARFIDLISEGEIEGLVNGEESVYFNNIPIRTGQSTYNYQGATYEFKPGAPDGIPLKEYPNSESEISVDIHITKTVGPIVRSITDPDVDDIRLTFTIPSLFKVNSENGDIKKTTVEWNIDVRASGGNYIRAADISKYGKCISSYQTDIRISDLTRQFGPGPWDVQVSRVTDDSTTNSLQNDVYWSSYTQIINRTMIYPDTSLIGVTLNSRQFGSRVPSRSYHIRGLRILIPKGYNPVDRSYPLIWDGTFERAYSDNPAWVLYDIATNNRYGLGLGPEYVDKWSLYTIAQYCDQLVDDNFGSLEPRFTFNGVFQRQTEMIHALNMICSNFRGMPYWAGGKLSVAQDAPKDSVKIVTAANVVDGLFTYSYSAIDTRYTVCNVSWNNPANFFRLEVEAVDDKDGLARYGYQPAEVTAVGCTSRGQAYRFGRWFLYTSLNETETVSYRASWDQADLVPGDIITLMDNHEAATQAGGRIVSTTSNTCTLDRGVTLEIGETYEMTFVDPEGSLVERTVTTIPDDAEHTVLDLSGSWPGDQPQVDSVWILSATNVEPKQYRVITNSEVEPNIYEITAVIYDANKYAAVEDGKLFSPPPLTKVPPADEQLTPPTNIQLEQYTYEDTGGTSERADRKTGVLLSWTHTRDTRFQNYEIQWKNSFGSFADNELIETTDNQYDIKPLESGEYTFRVRAIGLTRESLWLTFSEFTINSVPNAPPGVTGLTSIEEDISIGTVFNGKDCEIGWDAMTLATDTTSPIIYDGTSVVPTHYAPFDSKLTKIKDFQIEVLTVSDVHLRYDFVTDNKYKYFFGMNQLDNGQAIRDIKFRVWTRDIFDQLTDNPATIIVSNPAPSMSGLTPTVTNIFTGLQIDWRNITPTDNDMAQFKVYLDQNDPPTTLVAEVGVNTNSWIQGGLTAETTYRVQIEPWDEFGVGIKSDVVNGTPLKIAGEDINIELLTRLTITDSIDTTGVSVFDWMYDHLTGSSDPGATYNSGDWIKVSYPTEQLIDRVSIYADKTFNCYLSVSNDDGVTWTYYKAEGDHTLDSEGRVIEATNEADAITNYWTADSGAYSINIARFPNGLPMTDVRFHLLTNTTTFKEMIWTDQVIAEWIVANQLSAISADMGILTAGTIQSGNLTPTTGTFIDMNNDDLFMGGTNPATTKLWWDGGTQTLTIRGVIDVLAGSDVPWDEITGASKPEDNATDNAAWEADADQTKIDGGAIYVGSSINLSEGGKATFGNQNVIIDTAGNHGSIVVAEDGGPGRGSYCELSDGDINFQYWNGSTHIPYSSLTRLEAGVGNNNQWVYIPGIFKEVPKIMVSPNAIQSYNNAYRTASQKIRFEVINLQQYASKQWRFIPRATLDLSSGTTGGVNVGQNVTGPSNSSFWSYAVTDVLVNTRRLVVNFNATAYYRDNTFRVANYSGTGKDKVLLGYNYYFYASSCRYYVTLYVYVTGVGWKTWQQYFDPGYANYTGAGSWTIDTGGQPGNITQFKVLYSYYGSNNNRKRVTSTSADFRSGAGWFGALRINNYSSDQVATSVIEPGVLNWIAIGR